MASIIESRGTFGVQDGLCITESVKVGDEKDGLCLALSLAAKLASDGVLPLSESGIKVMFVIVGGSSSSIVQGCIYITIASFRLLSQQRRPLV